MRCCYGLDIEAVQGGRGRRAARGASGENLAHRHRAMGQQVEVRHVAQRVGGCALATCNVTGGRTSWRSRHGGSRRHRDMVGNGVRGAVRGVPVVALSWCCRGAEGLDALRAVPHGARVASGRQRHKVRRARTAHGAAAGSAVVPALERVKRCQAQPAASTVVRGHVRLVEEGRYCGGFSRSARSGSRRSCCSPCVIRTARSLWKAALAARARPLCKRAAAKVRWQHQ